MSATDELRKLLDERGVEYKSHYLNTSWYAGMKLYMATDDVDGTLTVDNLTPEQAIAATLGSTTRADRLLAELNNDRRINKQLKMVNALLRKSEAEKIKRIEELEELARDLHADLMEYGCTPNAHRANYKPRFEALGIEVDK